MITQVTRLQDAQDLTPVEVGVLSAHHETTQSRGDVVTTGVRWAAVDDPVSLVETTVTAGDALPRPL
jgi:hypothetical protein